MSTPQNRFTSLVDSLPPPTHQSLVPTATYEDIDTEAHLVGAIRALIHRYDDRREWRDRYPTEQSLADALVRFHHFTDSELAPFRHWELEHIRSWTTQQLVDWLTAQDPQNAQGIGSWTHFLDGMKVTGEQMYQTQLRYQANGGRVETYPYVELFTRKPRVQCLLNDGPYYNHRVAGHKLLGDIREEELARHFDQPTDRPLTNLDMSQGV